MATNLLKNRRPKSSGIFAVRIKTESNSLGLLKTLLFVGVIALQILFLILSYVYILSGFKYYLILSMALSGVACIYVLSSTSNGQAKATWIFFILFCYTFGYIVYFFSNEKMLLFKTRKKYKKIYENSYKYQKNINKINNLLPENQIHLNYLYNTGKFAYHKNNKLTYFSSGGKFFDNLINELKNAKHFIFLEFFIISNGVLLNRLLDVLKQKAKQGVQIRILYDDMGCHNKLKRKTKKEIKNSGIEIRHFNKFIPVFNLVMNYRDHRKIVIIDGKISYTGGINVADEYVNEKQIYGYWKDCGIKIEGTGTDNLTIAFLRNWQFVSKTEEDYTNFLNKAKPEAGSDIVVPFVSGPEFNFSIAKDEYLNMLAGAKEKLYIMTPYFIPEETITNMLIAKAKSGVDVKIILPEIADKKFVYVVSRDYAERLIASGVKIYTMTNSFVHSKIIANESSCVVGSINVDVRSFYQQYESAVYTNSRSVLNDVFNDFEDTIYNCKEITAKERKRNNLFYRIYAGVLRIISPFM